MVKPRDYPALISVAAGLAIMGLCAGLGGAGYSIFGGLAWRVFDAAVFAFGGVIVLWNFAAARVEFHAAQAEFYAERVRALEREIAELDRQRARIDQLIEVADRPDPPAEEESDD